MRWAARRSTSWPCSGTWRPACSATAASTTTTAKAKELRPFAEKLITLAKRGDLHSKRLAARHIQDRDTLVQLFDKIGPAVATRAGGYTRILKTGFRQGDGAETALIELVDRPGRDRAPRPRSKRRRLGTD